jgi:hypothetical protein
MYRTDYQCATKIMHVVWPIWDTIPIKSKMVAKKRYEIEFDKKYGRG